MSKKPLFPVTFGIPEEHSGLVQYHICSNGIYMTKKVSGRGSVTVEVKGIPGMGEGKESINVLPEKIPFSYFWKIIEFFKYVEKSFKADLEAFILVCYDYEKKGYFLWVPPHTVSMGSVKYDISGFSKLFPGSYILLDCHSHGSKISGFFSSTDDRDDNRERFSMVIGKINSIIPEYKIRFSTMGKFFEYDLDDIFTNEFTDGAILDIAESVKSIKLVEPVITKSSDDFSGYIPDQKNSRSLYDSIRYQNSRGFSIKDLMGSDW